MYYIEYGRRMTLCGDLIHKHFPLIVTRTTYLLVHV